MDIEFDPAKDATNLAKHRISLARTVEMEMAVFVEDERLDYGETRYRGWGTIDGLGYCLAFTNRDGKIRAISLRRAHEKEMRRYVPQGRI